MPIRVPKSTTTRSRGIELLTAAEASNPATAYCFTTLDMAVPMGTLGALVPLHGALVEGDDTFALHSGGHLTITKAGVYRFDVGVVGGINLHETGHALPGVREQNSGSISDYNHIGSAPVISPLGWFQNDSWVSVYWLFGPADLWLDADGSGDQNGYVRASLIATRLGDFDNLRYVDPNGADE